MRPCAELHVFLSAPQDRYFVGPQFLIWCTKDERCGTVAWGHITEGVTEQLVAAWDFIAKLAAPFHSVVDLGGVEQIDPPAFDLGLRYVTDKLELFAQRLGKQALVRPAGMPGAVVAGFYPTLSPHHEVRDFADRDAAFVWCWPTESTLSATVHTIVEQARGVPPLIGRLQAWLREHPLDTQLADAAQALGVAPRTLQRDLRDHETTFRAEAQAARVALATKLLVASDQKIEVIARRVGFTSVGTFGTLFRRATGETPSAYRAKRR